MVGWGVVRWGVVKTTLFHGMFRLIVPEVTTTRTLLARVMLLISPRLAAAGEPITPRQLYTVLRSLTLTLVVVEIVTIVTTLVTTLATNPPLRHVLIT